MSVLTSPQSPFGFPKHVPQSTRFGRIVVHCEVAANSNVHFDLADFDRQEHSRIKCFFKNGELWAGASRKCCIHNWLPVPSRLGTSPERAGTKFDEQTAPTPIKSAECQYQRGSVRSTIT